MLLTCWTNCPITFCMAIEPKIPKWPTIEATAKELGVSDWAIRKWAERGGVPGKWQIPIIMKSKGAVSMKDFAQGSQDSRS